jgi:hypothetical protein
MSYDLCSGDANIGFPMNIAGKLTQTDLAFKSIQASPDVYIAFGQMKERRFISDKVDEFQGCTIYDNSNTTINYNGISYKLVSIQLCKATHSGSQWPGRSGEKNDYDMVMTFKRESGSDQNNPSSFLFVIPIYSKTNKLNSTIKQTEVAKAFFEDTVKNTIDALSSVPLTNFVPKFTSYDLLFNDLASKQYVYYQSCIQLRPPPKGDNWTLVRQQIGVCLFVGGWIIDDFDTIMEKYIPYIKPYKYVKQARNGYFTAKRLPPMENSDNVLEFIRGGDNWSIEGELAGNALSVGEPSFVKRFRWIKDGVAGLKTAERLKTTLEYQCMPLNKLRDIDGQLVLLDPLTNTRALKEEIDGSAEDKAALAEIEAGKNSMRNIFIFLGSLAAIIVLLVGGSFLVRALLNRSNTPEGVESIAAAAVAMGAAAKAATTKQTASNKPKPEVSKTETPKPEAPKPEVSKTDAPKPEVSKTETPKPEVSKTDAPPTNLVSKSNEPPAPTPAPKSPV